LGGDESVAEVTAPETRGGRAGPRDDTRHLQSEYAAVRIVAWNVNHRRLEKAIPDRMIEAIASLGPDVVVLTEYVHGRSRDGFLLRLADHGLSNWLVTERRPGENQVLIAARTPLERGPIRAPEVERYMPSSALHIRMPQEGIEVLGIRVPDYSKEPENKRAYWNWISETASSVKDRPFVMIGDFNTDPKYERSRCGDCIKTLVDDGWKLAAPPDGSSFWPVRGDGVRIDHAFVSSHYAVERALYVQQLGDYIFAGKGSGALSDHAALVIDITPAAPILNSSPPHSGVRES
jgi:endonuclease/exonuclease/phosphatase family metal-dependent hydrolase